MLLQAVKNNSARSDKCVKWELELKHGGSYTHVIYSFQALTVPTDSRAHSNKISTRIIHAIVKTLRSRNWYPQYWEAGYAWPLLDWKEALLLLTHDRRAVDLPTSPAQMFSRARIASGWFFIFSAAKASERARAWKWEAKDFEKV